MIDVRYVPNLKKTLILLGVLESKGITITLRDGFLKVVISVLTVMKDTRRNNLYYFQGSTITGSSLTVFGKDVDLEATKLWHMCLGRASDKNIADFSKTRLTESCKFLSIKIL